MKYVICILIGYFFGCINFAYIIGRLKGFDIRNTGSGNAGVSNVTVALGWKLGIITAALDILKGYLAALVCATIFPDFPLGLYIGGASAVIGHIFPFYMQFKGGKGFASYIGFSMAIDWRITIIICILTIVITIVTDYIALATISSTFVMPGYLLVNHRWWYGQLAILVLLMIVMIYKHRINIKRIVNHEEIGLRHVNKHRVELKQ